MAAWSVQISDEQRVEHGAGKWWNALIIANEDPATKAAKPFRCALGCGYPFAKSAANATRIGNHVAGDTTDIVTCRNATPNDKTLAAAKRSSSRAPSAARRTLDVTSPTNVAQAASVLHAAGQMPSPEGISTTDDRHAYDAAVQETRRDGALQGLFRHMLTKDEADRLHMLWAKGLAHAGLPASIIDDEYIRHAIVETSMATAPYTPQHAQPLVNTTMPKYEETLSSDLRAALSGAKCRTLQFDGWNTITLSNLLNLILISPAGAPHPFQPQFNHRP